MTSLFDLFERLDEEEAVMRGELTALREKATVVEDRLSRLEITRETALSLLGDAAWSAAPPTGSSSESEEPPAPEEEMPGGGPGTDEPAAEEVKEESPDPDPRPAEPLDLQVARKRILVLLAGAGQAMKVQDISVAIGEHNSRVETTRSRLKKLAKEGLLREVRTAWFVLVPNAAEEPVDGEEGAAGTG